jgi:hypothetical protein
METFNQWIKNNHPEYLNEDWKKIAKLAAGPLAIMGGLGSQSAGEDYFNRDSISDVAQDNDNFFDLAKKIVEGEAKDEFFRQPNNPDYILKYLNHLDKMLMDGDSDPRTIILRKAYEMAALNNAEIGVSDLKIKHPDPKMKEFLIATTAKNNLKNKVLSISGSNKNGYTFVKDSNASEKQILQNVLK